MADSSARSRAALVACGIVGATTALGWAAHVWRWRRRQRSLRLHQSSGAVQVEICVSGADDAVAAAAGGAHRVELCDNLGEGGTTPSIGMVHECVRALAGSGTEVHVIVRPRGGDFCYSEAEFRAMLRDVAEVQRAGADGVVVGVLRPNGAVSVHHVARLVAAARPLAVTFHRAFDMCREPFAALDDLAVMGVDRVLTSGQAPCAWEGRELLRRLVRHVAASGPGRPPRPAIAAAAGVSAANATDLVTFTGCAHVHAGSSVAVTVDSAMEYRPSASAAAGRGEGHDDGKTHGRALQMGSRSGRAGAGGGDEEFLVRRTCGQKVSELVAAVRAA